MATISSRTSHERTATNGCGADIQRVVGKLAAAEKERSEALFKRYVYIEQQERYYDLAENSLLKQGQFIDRNAPLFGMKRDLMRMCTGRPIGRRTAAGA